MKETLALLSLALVCGVSLQANAEQVIEPEPETWGDIVLEALFYNEDTYGIQRLLVAQNHFDFCVLPKITANSKLFVNANI